MRQINRVAFVGVSLLLALYVWYFADHALRMLAHPYPLDYGEGPLVAQVERLRSEVPIHQLYADPQEPPYLIINYPPLYLLLSAWLPGSALVVGRTLSLLGALMCVAAIGLLAGGRRNALVWLAALLFLSVPIVREWAALMRVDLLGVACGLWGLLLIVRSYPQMAQMAQIQGHPSQRSSFARSTWMTVLGGLLIGASLYIKPSLIAAPATALALLLWQWWWVPAARRATQLRLGLLIGTLLLGGVLFGVLQWATNGWFALHVVAANANRWEFDLAWGFWEQQFWLRWPLAAAGALAIWWRRKELDVLFPAICYALMGVVTAIGVGKVGAYSNYFLELYAGLIWLIALGMQSAKREIQQAAASAKARTPGGSFAYRREQLSITVFAALLIGSMLYYPPLWDANRLRPAGLLEPSPPRLAVGGYGLWDDMAREAAVLAALSRVGDALNREVQAAGPLIFSDLPGIPAAAGAVSRLQVFEARQLFDQDLAEQDALLLELANGELPLAALDYLGNWLTPEMITLLQRRYAQDGAFGTIDMFRPIAPGDRITQELAFPAAGLQLRGYRIGAPLGDAYEPGELLAITTEWQALAPNGTPPVRLMLRDSSGSIVANSERPLLYDAFPPQRWPDNAVVQHLQPLSLPVDLPAGRYTLEVGLGDGTPQELTTIAIAPAGGMFFAETGYFVPARVMRAWAEQGGIARGGYPLTPLVPFAWGRLQCFERICLEVRDGEVQQRPLGERMYLAETMRSDICGNGRMPNGELCAPFGNAREQFMALGEAVSGEIFRNGWMVQWTEYARLERTPASDQLDGLGRLGDESLRLAPGQSYRWP